MVACSPSVGDDKGDARASKRHRMTLWGTVNPDGEDDSHSGVLLRERDIHDLASTSALVGKPVKIEHEGPDVGRVIHAWQHDKRLDCILEIDNDTAASLFARSFVNMGKTRELSLGYRVTMRQSAEGMVRGGEKEVLEVSLVRKGARHNCIVHGISRGGGAAAGK